MSDAPILEVRNVSRSYRKGGFFGGTTFKAVDEVSFVLPAKPQVFSVVGESGSGKTTLARMVLRLVEPSSGEMRLLGRPLTGKEGRIDDLEFRRLVQPIFQNPFEAFSAYLPIEEYLRRTALTPRAGCGNGAGESQKTGRTETRRRRAARFHHPPGAGL